MTPEPGAKALTPAEKAYLRKFLKEHYEFYRRIAEHGSTPGNRKLFELVRGLWDKLQ
jgi:hypothetical protein